MRPMFEIRRDPATGEQYLETALHGRALLEQPLLNKGSAFTEAERHAFGLVGLLPPGVSAPAVQLERIYGNYRQKTSNLERYIHLVSLQDRNETAFYRLLSEHLVEMMPIIYTPVVGEACQAYSRHLPPAARALHLLSAPRRDRRGAGQPRRPGRRHHRRDRRRAHPGARRPGHRRHGHSDRQAVALQRVRGHSSGDHAADHSRRRHEQPGAAGRSAVPGLAPPANPRRGVRRVRRGVRERGDETLPARAAAVGRLREEQRGALAGALPRPAVLVQRRHPRHRCGDACGGDGRRCRERRAVRRAARRALGRGLSGSWHHEPDRHGDARRRSD